MTKKHYNWYNRHSGVLYFMNDKKYECKFCGYIYEPETGDSENGIDKGTSFDSIPSTWICPICGAEKEAFIENDRS